MSKASMLSKVPRVVLAFWVIKICATTLGETGGDALSMTLNLGYAVSTAIFFGIFLLTLAAQVSTDRYHPLFYWSVIVATTTAGTTLSDYLTRSAGLGYLKTSLLLFALVLGTLALWRHTTGSVSVNNITSCTAEVFYWMTIFFSNTLGTALGDCVADTTGLGYTGGAIVFAGALALVAAAYYHSKISRTLLFWAAFILTRPLGATLGDLLTKLHEKGGMELSRISSTLILAVVMICLILTFSRSSERDVCQPD